MIFSEFDNQKGQALNPVQMRDTENDHHRPDQAVSKQVPQRGTLTTVGGAFWSHCQRSQWNLLLKLRTLHFSQGSAPADFWQQKPWSRYMEDNEIRKGMSICCFLYLQSLRTLLQQTRMNKTKHLHNSTKVYELLMHDTRLPMTIMENPVLPSYIIPENIFVYLGFEF